ncbi:MAG: DUF4383 domain-containing protein [Bdellovibrionota bacterium]
MQPRKYALFGGILMLVMGVLALVPALYDYPSAMLPALKVNTSYGLFLGIFPMNIYNKLALIVFGATGIIASQMPTTALPASVKWARAVFVVMGIAAILGLFQRTDTLNGYWPLFGAEVWTHGIFAVLGAYFGFALTHKATSEIKPLIEAGKRSRRVA